jgi:hypothetical protein
MTDTIVMNGISKIYNIGGEEVRALDNASLRIAQGEFVSVVGPSGSGWIRGSLEYGFDIIPLFVASRPEVVWGGGFDPIVLKWNSIFPAASRCIW